MGHTDDDLVDERRELHERIAKLREERDDWVRDIAELSGALKGEQEAHQVSIDEYNALKAEIALLRARASLVWMPHAGHFICGGGCAFRLNTYVPTGYIVSTVGELKLDLREDSAFHPLGAGADSLYETMVFEAEATSDACCPWQQASGTELDGERYATAEAATAGHMRYVEKYAGSGRGMDEMRGA